MFTILVYCLLNNWCYVRGMIFSMDATTSTACESD
jgi:hypothetical protein